MPASIAARVVRRDGSAPQVRGLRLDTNFGAVDVAKCVILCSYLPVGVADGWGCCRSGKVNIAIQGATVSGAQSDIVVPGVNSRRAHPRAFKRQVLGGFVDNAIDGELILLGLSELGIDEREFWKPSRT